ncbi:transposable element Tcb2 transposase [Trichonephila clavipes]|nr:transposable element Tcb2 transposase [Trichonephila clavipes]
MESRPLYGRESVQYQKRFSTRFDLERSGHGFIPVTSRKDTITVVLEFLSGRHYAERVLLPHVGLFRGAIGPDFIFMDDNARPHRTLADEELLESEDITRMDWPAYSPDLNPSNMCGMFWGDVLQHAYIIRRTPNYSNRC